MRLKQSKFHFIGVGGIGMCGLAELLAKLGAQVSGSDLVSNANTERLLKAGVKIFQGHHAENVQDAEVVVYSSAVKSDNPEMRQARALKIPVIPRAEALAEIMRLKRGIAVGGTHGKTTTTSMISSIFLAANSNPTIVIGGRFDQINSTAYLGTGEWMIAEADESDGSFQKLSPEIAVITNIDADHLDYFKSFENLQTAFLNFSERVPFYGSCIACGDDPVVREVLKNYPKKLLFYGFDPENDFWIKGEKGEYEIFERGGKSIGHFHLSVPGVHNALNALASIAVGLESGFSFDVCRKGIENYQGVDRRFQFKGHYLVNAESSPVAIYDDYGHHPTEVRATLQAFKEKFSDRRLVVMFQPHRFSRTEHCWVDFTQSFSQADIVVLTDIYAAGERPIPGISSERLVKELKHSDARYLPKDDSLTEKVMQILAPGDVFVTLGAGDGWKIGMNILNHLS